MNNHRVKQIVSADHGLAELRRNTERLVQATTRMAELVDPVICKHCQIAKLSADELVIVVDASVWAGRIRYLAPQLARHFSSPGGRVPEISIKVRTPPVKPKPAKRKAIDGTSRAILAQTAEQFEDGRLKRALQRLAQHAEIAQSTE